MRFRLLTSCALMLGMSFMTSCGGHDFSDKQDKKHSFAGNEDGILRIAHVNEAAGDLAAAERQYKQAVAMSGKTVGARLELADFYKRQNASAAAVDTLKEAHDLQPKNTEITRALANAYISAGTPAKALELLNDDTAENNKDPLLYNSKGVALDMLGRYSEAQTSYQKALQLNPSDDVTFKTNLSMSYILSGSYNKAIVLLMPLLNSPQATPNIRQNLALAYGLSGQSDKALKLGLKDLSTKEAEENLKFYRMLATSQNGTKNVPIAPITSKNDAKNNPFLEDDDREEPPPPSFAEVKSSHIAAAKKAVVVPPAHTIPEEDDEMADEDDTAAPMVAVTPKAPIIKSSAKTHVPAAVAKPTVSDPEPVITGEPAARAMTNILTLPEPTLKPDRSN